MGSFTDFVVNQSRPGLWENHTLACDLESVKPESHRIPGTKDHVKVRRAGAFFPDKIHLPVNPLETI